MPNGLPASCMPFMATDGRKVRTRLDDATVRDVWLVFFIIACSSELRNVDGAVVLNCLLRIAYCGFIHSHLSLFSIGLGLSYVCRRPLR